MNKEKRCTNCGKFPFCDEDLSTGESIENCWIKRQVEMKLDSKKGEVFDFNKVK
jgi:hypothetical protein